MWRYLAGERLLSSNHELRKEEKFAKCERFQLCIAHRRKNPYF